jgi:acetyl-CoA carboxylase beta subunit
MAKCFSCKCELHAANWWHDAEVCNQCGEYMDIDVTLSFPPIKKVESDQDKRLKLLQILLSE